MGDIPIGAKGAETLTIAREHTVASHDPRMPEVFATPMMIYLMETTAADLVAPFLPEGWITVGVHVDVRHLAATPVGATVIATATVTAVDANTITFAVEAHDGIEKIGEGTHTRAKVELARFIKRMLRKVTQSGSPLEQHYAEPLDPS